MDCHNCEYIRYDGHRYGRCAHPGHSDVKFVAKKDRPIDSKRPYCKLVCKEFCLRKRCSNCENWIRGEYFRDGETPARKGYCKFNIQERNGGCPKWESAVKNPRNLRGDV